MPKRFSERPVGSEVKAKIIELFERRHLVSSAYHTYCCMKMEELGDSYENLVFDRHYFPKKKKKKMMCLHYGKQILKNTMAIIQVPFMLLKLEELLKYHEKNSSIRFKISKKMENMQLHFVRQ